MVLDELLSFRTHFWPSHFPIEARYYEYRSTGSSLTLKARRISTPEGITCLSKGSDQAGTAGMSGVSSPITNPLTSNTMSECQHDCVTALTFLRSAHQTSCSWMSGRLTHNGIDLAPVPHH